GRELTLGYLGWDENVANSNLIKVLLEDEFGYETVELKLADDVRPVFEGVASGELDAFTDVWMPNHRALVDEVEDEAELSEESWYTGQTEYGIAVPHYMRARSIADLDSSEAGMIVGIEPGAVLMQKISENVIPGYDIDLELVEASTPAMLAELRRAYGAKEPIVFLAWSPHWMNAEYDFRYLEDPKDTMGPLDEPAELHSIMRNGLEEDDPVAYALINTMKLDEVQVDTLELAINRAGDPQEGVHDWLENNRDVVQPWIEAAKQKQ
ncbi:MAG: glycine betaine ABC transporter substrate-binding protein, partial [Actinobacteria bacterium]|nr:glycine betaine ABC transporter substrate-binding protein [Actinomycetota bacterium]